MTALLERPRKKSKKINFFQPEWEAPEVLHFNPARDGILWKSIIDREYGYGDSTVTLREFLCKIAGGAIVPFTNNRGKGQTARATVNSVRDNLHLPSLGTIVLARDGSIAYMTDGHSRVQGLLERLQTGKLTEEELDASISIREVRHNEMMDVYAKCNSVKSHTAAQDLRTPQYQFGSLINKVYRAVKPTDERWIEGSTKTTNVAYMLYAFGNHDSDFETISPDLAQYSDIFSCRQQCRTIYKSTAVLEFPFTVSEATIKKIVDGISYYAEFSRLLTKAISSQENKDAKKLLPSGPFFAMIVMDRMRKKPRLPGVETFVRRCLRKSGVLRPYVAAISAADVDIINMNENNIWKTLR